MYVCVFVTSSLLSGLSDNETDFTIRFCRFQELILEYLEVFNLRKQQFNDVIRYSLVEYFPFFKEINKQVNKFVSYCNMGISDA